MTDAAEAELARAARAIADGAPTAALTELMALLEAHPADARPYAEAARALFACVESGVLELIDRAELDRLVRRLVSQADCPARPLIFHHEIASRLTSKSAQRVEPLVKALEPTLRAMLDEGSPAPTALLLFLMIARESLGPWLPQARLTALHLAAFPGFTERDMSLPYSVMFHGGAFARNRDDLIDRLAADGPAFLATLRPRHLPLLAWLRGGRSPFPDAAAFGAWLASVANKPLDATDRQAARALVLAEGVPGGLDEAAREALGLDGATLAEADRLSAARAGLPREQGSAAARRLEQRPWQALAAARALAATRAPFLARGQRRVKVAVCVSGQLRGFRRVLPRWRDTIFAHAEVHYFVHAWAAIGRGPAQPWRVSLPFSGDRFVEAYRRLATQEGLEAFEARYPTLYAALATSGTVTADEVRAVYGTAHAIVDDERDEPFAGFSNQQKMHYKIRAAHELMRASGEAFDLVVRIRPDFDVRLAALDWRDLRAACAGGPRLYADAAFGVHHGVPMIGDQFAVAAPPAMERYAATWETYPRIAALDITGASRDFLGHVSLAQTCWLNGIAVRRAPIRIAGLREPEPFAGAAIVAALEADAAGRIDAIDRALIDAARADLAG